MYIVNVYFMYILRILSICCMFISYTVSFVYVYDIIIWVAYVFTLWNLFMIGHFKYISIYLHLYLSIYCYCSIYVSIHIYIYIERERERESLYVSLSYHICIYIYIYIYIHIYYTHLKVDFCGWDAAPEGVRGERADAARGADSNTDTTTTTNNNNNYYW